MLAQINTELMFRYFMSSTALVMSLTHSSICLALLGQSDVYLLFLCVVTVSRHPCSSPLPNLSTLHSQKASPAV